MKINRLIIYGCLLFVFIISARIVFEFSNLKTPDTSAWKTSQVADCAVVLTGGSSRLREGFDLLSQKRIQKLIISGVNPDSQTSEIFPQIIFYPEIQDEDVVLERRSTTTWGNAQQSLPFVEALRCRTVFLITSSLHMPRAFKTFQSVFPSTIELIKQPVITSHFDPKYLDRLAEAGKFIFYSLWAF